LPLGIAPYFLQEEPSNFDDFLVGESGIISAFNTAKINAIQYCAIEITLASDFKRFGIYKGMSPDITLSIISFAILHLDQSPNKHNYIYKLF
jgi:hypothetical protein